MEVTVDGSPFPPALGVKSKKRERRKGSENFTIMGGV